MITALYQLLAFGLNLFKWALILAAIASTLISFGVLDSRNRLVWTINDFLYRVTEPVLRPIRNMLPNFGGVDISALIVIVLIQFVALPLLDALYAGIVYGTWNRLFL